MSRLISRTHVHRSWLSDVTRIRHESRLMSRTHILCHDWVITNSYTQVTIEWRHTYHSISNQSVSKLGHVTRTSHWLIWVMSHVWVSGHWKLSHGIRETSSVTRHMWHVTCINYAALMSEQMESIYTWDVICYTSRVLHVRCDMSYMRHHLYESCRTYESPNGVRSHVWVNTMQWHHCIHTYG